MSRIDVSLGSVFTGSNAQLYKYEPFSGNVFTLGTGVGPNDTMEFTSSPILDAFLVHDTSRQTLFYSTNGPTTTGSNLTFTIQDISGTVVMDSRTYTVNIGAGRFLPPRYDGELIEFYKNEPVGNNYVFTGIFPIAKPSSTISLPAGLVFVNKDTCSYYLTGTPTVQSPTSNYNIIATGLSPYQSRIIGIKPNIRVNGERVRLDISGTGISSNVTWGSNITPIAVSGRCPPYVGGAYPGGNIRYTWSPLPPDGLYFSDNSGTALNFGGIPMADSSSTVILRGAITNTAIQSLDLSSGILDISLTGTRVSQPFISKTTSIQVRFKESVVFSEPYIRPLYKDASVNSSVNSNSFFARSLFASPDVSINSITSADLPTGVILDFSSNAQRAFLKGTPSGFVGSHSSTIRATNANSIFAEYPVTFDIRADSVSFSPITIDACSAFIAWRSVENPKTGYYKAPIQFTATSASGCNVSMSISDISGTGLTFSGTTGSNVTYTLRGTPTGAKSLTTSVVTASVPDTSVSNTTSFQYLVVPERYFFQDASINAIQNVPITSTVVQATTLSERPVIWYASTNLPPGLAIDTTGIINGTVIGRNNGTFTIRASTGVTIDSCSFPYYVKPDSILMLTPQSSYTYDAGANVSIQVTGLSYSGVAVSNYRFSGLPATGLTINPSSGLITGPLSDNIPPNPILPTGPVAFDVCGNVGAFMGGVNATFTTTSSPVRSTITFQTTSSGGPTFTSPAQTSYVFYQYMPIPDMTFSAVGTGSVYIFVDRSSLPTGLVWDTYTQTIRGKTVNVGTYTFTVYAKDSVGVTARTVSVTTIIPRVVRQQTSAGAYTYLVKQYTEVNAAQNARDNHVMPTQEVPLGKFMAPDAPDVITPDRCKKC